MEKTHMLLKSSCGQNQPFTVNADGERLTLLVKFIVNATTERH